MLTFVMAPRDVLRMIVGLLVGAIALGQFHSAGRRHCGTLATADLASLSGFRWLTTHAGAFSANTGTGVAEIHQPMPEHEVDLETKRANATVIMIEAMADWAITAVNLSLGNLRLDILIFSASGVLIGAQIGALLSPCLPDRLLKVVFVVGVLGIAVVYIVTSAPSLMHSPGAAG